jgi:hypothetical protein
MPFIQSKFRVEEAFVLIPRGLLLALLQLRLVLLNHRPRLLNKIVIGGGVQAQEKAPIFALLPR